MELTSVNNGIQQAVNGYPAGSSSSVKLGRPNSKPQATDKLSSIRTRLTQHIKLEFDSAAVVLVNKLHTNKRLWLLVYYHPHVYWAGGDLRIQLGTAQYYLSPNKGPTLCVLTHLSGRGSADQTISISCFSCGLIPYQCDGTNSQHFNCSKQQQQETRNKQKGSKGGPLY